MLAGVDWEAVTLAGAFIVGAVLATVATLPLGRPLRGNRKPSDKAQPRDR